MRNPVFDALLVTHGPNFVVSCRAITYHWYNNERIGLMRASNRAASAELPEQTL